MSIRPLAIQDIHEIVQYLDRSSERATDAFLARFSDATSKLAEMPGMGVLRRKRGRSRGLRSWPLRPFGPYIIFYMPSGDGIEVVRVLHGARNVDRILRDH